MSSKEKEKTVWTGEEAQKVAKALDVPFDYDYYDLVAVEKLVLYSNGEVEIKARLFDWLKEGETIETVAEKLSKGQRFWKNGGNCPECGKILHSQDKAEEHLNEHIRKIKQELFILRKLGSLHSMPLP